MQFRRVHPLAIGVVILALIVSFLCGAAWGQEPNRSARTTGSGWERPTPRDAHGAAWSGTHSVPLSVTGAETAVASLAWRWQQTAWLEAVAAGLIAEAERTRPFTGTPGTSSSAGGSVGSSGGSCDGHVVPSYILQRESGCSYDAYNATGCGGSGCIGMYQLDAKHFSNTCAGLDTSPAGQDACAQRLVDAAGLSPWGG